MASKSLRFPNVGHIGAVVKNIDRVIEYYLPVFGIGPFEIYDFRPQKAWVCGQKVKPFELRIATADVGSAKMELIQVIRGDPPPPRLLRGPRRRPTTPWVLCRKLR